MIGFTWAGQDSLRGFNFNSVGPRESSQDGTEFEPIGGDTYWFASAEYTIPLIDRLSFAIFYDIGNVSQRAFSNSGFEVQERVSSNRGIGDPFTGTFFGETPFGSTGAFSDDFGIGLRLTIPTLGPLRLDYGIPIHHDIFSGSGGKFQFGAGFSRPL